MIPVGDKVILIEGEDAKADALIEALSAKGVQARPLTVKPFMFWWAILRGRISSRREIAVVRYLNDNRNPLVSLVKVLGDTLTLLVSRTTGLRCLWLCHNVDQETERYWPGATQARRWLWVRTAKRILITDPDLMEAAKRCFPRHRDKLHVVPLAPIPPRTQTGSSEAVRRIRRFFGHGRSSDQPEVGSPLNILVAGLPGPKYLHFRLLPQLHGALKDCGYQPRIVIVSPIGDPRWQRGQRYDELIHWALAQPDVLLVDDWIEFSETDLADCVHLVWRAMSDFSLPFTLFNAARAGIPILTYDSGFLGQIVERRNIGACVNREMSNVCHAVARALAVGPAELSAFLKGRTWDRAAAALVSAAYDDRARPPDESSGNGR